MVLTSLCVKKGHQVVQLTYDGEGLRVEGDATAAKRRMYFERELSTKVPN
jgi:YD repeat-containing protein